MSHATDERVSEPIRLDFADERAASRVAEFVQAGGVVVFPTESSYALGADPTNADAVGRVFQMKGREAGKPLPVVVGDAKALSALGVPKARPECGGLEKGWPGALTLILPTAADLPASAGRPEVAVRVIGHEPMRDLLARAELSLTATSANLTGEEPVLDPADLDSLVGEEDVLILDGGVLEGGPPSTLVKCEGKRATVLRSGAVSVEALRSLAPSLRFSEGFSAAIVEIPVEGEA